MYFWFGLLFGISLSGIVAGLILIWTDRPKRNCDIGTTKEQIKRFHEFCSAHNDCYKCDCPVDNDDGGCMIRWAQMPYEKGDNNDK